MGLPRRIVEAAKRVVADPFGPDAARELVEAPEVAAILGDVARATGSNQPGASMLLVLQCLAILQSELASASLATEFVATMPRGIAEGIRPTAVVVREMMERALVDVVALGYVITPGGGIIELLHRAAVRGAAIHVVCDRQGRSLDDVGHGWPQGVPPPALYMNSEDPDGSLLSKMHCKLLIIDERDVLVTSANFTLCGLAENIEFGVRMTGPAAVTARRFFESLCSQRLILRRPIGDPATG